MPRQLLIGAAVLLGCVTASTTAAASAGRPDPRRPSGASRTSGSSPLAGAPSSGSRPLDGAAPASRPGPVVRPDYRAPVTGPLQVVRPFAPPRTAYGPGHLGVDLRAADGSAVLAAGAGTVTFAGQVAGRGVLVIAHPDGIRTEYEPLQPRVRVGVQVREGQLIGTVRGDHRGCRGACLHWGARRGAVYLDPLLLLRPLGPVRLLPWRADHDHARG